jgi:LAO/AO transport system kinase
MDATGELVQKRREQQVRWMWAMIDDRLRDDLRSSPEVMRCLEDLEADVRAGTITPTAAVDDVWARYRGT